MGARHSESIMTLVQNRGFSKLEQVFGETRKVASYQLPIPPTSLTVTGGAVVAGGGTIFPILYPVLELGSVSNSQVVTISLANKALHYQVMSLSNSGNYSFQFSGLSIGRAVTFTLDITIATSSIGTINWPSNLFGVPSNLPTTQNSRYILYISGFKDTLTENYYVVGSSGSSGTTGILWSNVVIDQNKDMKLTSLSNLQLITFDQDFDNLIRQISGVHGTGMIFDLGTNTAQVKSTEAYFFKKNATEILHIDQLGLTMNDAPINNINTLYFFSNGTNPTPAILSDGLGGNIFLSLNDQNVFNVNYSSTLGANAYFFNPYNTMNLHLSNAANPKSTFNSISSLLFDGYNLSFAVKSYSQILSSSVSSTPNSELGQLDFNVIQNGSQATMMTLTQDPTKGIGVSFHGNALYTIGLAKFLQGTFISENLGANCLQINFPSNVNPPVTFLRLMQTNNSPYLDLTQNALVPYTSMTVGSITNFFGNAYISQSIFFANNNALGTFYSIGIDNATTPNLLLNTQSNSSINFAVNRVIQASLGSTGIFTANTLQGTILQIQVSTNTPAIGQFVLSSSGDVQVFSGGLVRNLSNIPTSAVADIKLDNLSSTTNINSSLIPQLQNSLPAFDVGSLNNFWRFVYHQQSIFQVGESVSAGQFCITIPASFMTFNVPSISNDAFSFQFGGQESIRIGGTSIIPGSGFSGGINIGSSGNTFANIYLQEIFLSQNTNNLDPTINGQIVLKNNGGSNIDVEVFSGGAVRNLSQIGAGGGANTQLSNLSLTAINQSLIPSNSEANIIALGSSTNPYFSLYVGTGSVFVGDVNHFMEMDNGNNLSFNTAAGTRINFAVGTNIKAYIDPSGNFFASNATFSNGDLLLGNLGLDPISNGEFTRNQNDVKIFSGGAVRNQSLTAQDISAYRIPNNSGTERWYTSLGTSITNNTTPITLQTGKIYLIPFVISKATKIDGLGIYVTNAVTVGTNIEFGIYTDNGNVYPKNLVSGSDAQLSVPSSGVVSITPLSIAQFNPGQLIWLAITSYFAGVTTVAINSNNVVPILGVSPNDLGFSTTPSYAYILSFSGTSLPASIVNLSTQFVFSNMPAIHCRIASQT